MLFRSNLDAGGFIVEVWSGDEYVYPESITLTNSNTVTITFAEPVAGKAVLVYFAREFSVDNVFLSLLDGGYCLIGDENNEFWDPVANNGLYSATASGSVRNGRLVDRGDMFTFDFSIPTGTAYTIKEIGLFDREDNIMFYTRCSELYKPSNVQLDIHYRLLKE